MRKLAQRLKNRSNLVVDSVLPVPKMIDEVVRSLPDAVFAVDLKGEVIAWNRAMEEMTGCPAAEIVGRGNREYALRIYGKRCPLLIDAALGDSDIDFSTYSNIRNENGTYMAETRLTIPGKPVVEAWVKTGPVLDERGRTIGAIEVIRDATERKAVEESLRQLNRELRALSLCNEALMHRTDEQSLLQEICRIICEVAGYSMVWVGMLEFDQGKAIRPVAIAGHDDGYVAQADITWDDTLRGRGPTGTAARTGRIRCIGDFEADVSMAPWRAAARERGYRSVAAFPLLRNGNAVFGVLSIYSAKKHAFSKEEVRLMEELANDLAFGITTLRERAERHRVEESLKESEIRFQKLIEEAPVAVGVLRHGRLAFANLRYLKMFCFGSLEEVVGIDPLEQIAPQERERMRQRIWSRQIGGAFYRDEYETVGLRKTGETFPLQVNMARVNLDEGYVIVGFLTDISSRKMAEEQKRQLLEQERKARLEAERAVQLREDFIAIASHELRTPLTPLRLYLDLLTRQMRKFAGDPKKTVDPLIAPMESLDREVKRLTELVEDLLDVSRISSGGFNIRKAPVDFTGLVIDVVNRYRRESERAECRLEIAVERPLEVLADRGKIEEVVGNLIANAIKFGAGRPIEVRLDTSEGCARLSVRDHGIGISRGDQERIFQRFSRVGSVRNYPGLGIGLYISRKILEAHHGTITVESEPDKGSVFTARLPLA